MRQVKLFDILDLVSCAQDYGHWNDVCMSTLYEFAQPVTDETIKMFVDSFPTEYGDEDREEITTKITEWRDKYAKLHVKKEKS